MSSKYGYDLCVIGGGSGGVRAARLAGQRGLRVALFEKSRLGGTCVIRGCVPKKFCVYASRYHDEFALARSFGWATSSASFDWPALRDGVQAEVSRLSGLYGNTLAKSGVEVIEGDASFVDANTISGGGQTITAQNTVIAVGGKPLRPNVPGIEHAIVSDDIFVLPELPASMAIVGGGYIALEFACLLQRLGVAVTLIHRSGELLRGFDADMRRHIVEAMEADGVKIRLNTSVAAITKLASGAVSLDLSGEVAEFGGLFYAVGRRAVSASLNCSAAGIATHDNGNIIVDANSRTSTSNIFAVGDVTGRKALTPVAIREAVNLIGHLYDGTTNVVDYSNVPTAVFTTPEVGTVGMSEEEAREKHEIDVYIALFRPMKFALSSASASISEKSLFKLIVDKQTDRVLGAHIICEGAGELIQLLGALVARGTTKAELDSVVAVHPTMAEELVTMHSPTR